jgi:hypothetical protein
MMVLWLHLLAWQIGSLHPSFVQLPWLPAVHCGQVQVQTGFTHFTGALQWP